jgi:hypothetical protein
LKKSDQFRFKCRKMVNYYAIRSTLRRKAEHTAGFIPSGLAFPNAPARKRSCN